MYLAITDGTTTVVLSGTSPVLGCTYFPSAPARNGGDWQPVTETAEINLRGTAAAIRTTTNAIESLLDAAVDRQTLGVGPRVFAMYKILDSDSVTYRSEVYGGRLAWSENPALRRLGDTNPTVRVAVIWQRAYWWEGDEVEASISANAQAAATGGRTVTNDPANGNWVQAAAAQVTGILPTPARLVLSNSSGATRKYAKVFLSLNANSDPANLVTAYQAEAFGGGGTPTADATASGGSKLNFSLSNATATYTWLISQSSMQRTKGRRARLLARITDLSGSLYATPSVRTANGEVLWEGDEISLGPLIYGAWVDLGLVPVPPGGANAAYAAERIALTFRGTGIASLDVVQLTMIDSYRVLDLGANGIAAADGAAIVLDGTEGQVYITASSVNIPLPANANPPLMLQPGMVQRIHVLYHLADAGNYAPITTTMSVRVFYRPRRLTV